MFKNKRKLQLLAAFTTLFLLAFGVGCKGFFVNPTLTSVQVGPTVSIQQSKTVQESATGTYDDNTTKTITSGVFWSIADSSGTNVATISASGLVMGTSPGTATVTGSVGTVTGTSTITVTLFGLTSIDVTPHSMTITSGSPQQYVATGTANGQQVVITDSVDWALNAGSVTGVSIDSSTGLVTTTSGDTGTVTITATDPTTGIISNTATLIIQ